MGVALRLSWHVLRAHSVDQGSWWEPQGKAAGGGKARERGSAIWRTFRAAGQPCGWNAQEARRRFGEKVVGPLWSPLGTPQCVCLAIGETVPTPEGATAKLFSLEFLSRQMLAKFALPHEGAGVPAAARLQAGFSPATFFSPLDI
jgi:hypothetical protein